MTTLEHAVILVRGLCRSLVDLDTVTRGRGPDPELLEALGRLLNEVADAVRTFGETLAASVPGPQANQAPLLRALARARAARDDVAKAMAAGPREEPEPGRSTATCWPTSTGSSPNSTPRARPGPAAAARPELRRAEPDPPLPGPPAGEATPEAGRVRAAVHSPPSTASATALSYAGLEGRPQGRPGGHEERCDVLLQAQVPHAGRG
jgi:hypothetical protein